MGGMNGRPGRRRPRHRRLAQHRRSDRQVARPRGLAGGRELPGDSEAAEAVVEEITSAGGRAKALQGDIADPETADQLFKTLEDEFGPVLVLVNNAGVRADGLSPRSTTRTGRR